ncbi:MAG: DUF1353 domain-containing protein [Alphaproteobacteria bacterium]|nr:DUF1353 domain-containing protein [Alphaproteobacteria bacterium]
MRGLLFQLVVLVGVFALGSFVVFDDPAPVYRDAIEAAACKVDEQLCPPKVAKLIVPGVNVLFVDKSLAMREGRQVAILADDWPYCDEENGDVFQTPQFFETDFASIPSFARFYINPQDPEIVGAAIIHDWLYAIGGDDRDAAKARADEIFRFELGEAGVNVIKRNIMYQAVNRFGGKTFGDAVEMRFRNPATGAPFMQPKPASPVIDNLGPGCPGFLAKYWNPDDATIFKSYELSPLIIQSWIDL